MIQKKANRGINRLFHRDGPSSPVPSERMRKETSLARVRHCSRISVLGARSISSLVKQIFTPLLPAPRLVVRIKCTNVCVTMGLADSESFLPIGDCDYYGEEI